VSAYATCTGLPLYRRRIQGHSHSQVRLTAVTWQQYMQHCKVTRNCPPCAEGQEAHTYALPLPPQGLFVSIGISMADTMAQETQPLRNTFAVLSEQPC
jgi:hypothetical protein